jgi:hypothetical protein
MRVRHFVVLRTRKSKQRRRDGGLNAAPDFKTVVQERHRQSFTNLTKRLRIYKINNNGTFTLPILHKIHVFQEHFKNIPFIRLRQYKEARM